MEAKREGSRISIAQAEGTKKYQPSGIEYTVLWEKEKIQSGRCHRTLK